MGKGKVVAVVTGVVAVGAAGIQAVCKLNELRKARKETKRLKAELEQKKREAEFAEFEKVKRMIEEQKKNDTFKAEMENLIKTGDAILNAKDDEELDKVLTEAEEKGVLKKPWTGDFDEFMSDPNTVLRF